MAQLWTLILWPNTAYDYQTFLATIDNSMTFLYDDEYIGEGCFKLKLKHTMDIG